MSNLGLYQTLTTIAKKVGGPGRLVLLIGVGGYAVLRPAEAGAKKIIKMVKNNSNAKSTDLQNESVVCTVTTAASIDKGVKVNIGDKIKVCAIDKDAVMIEILGNENNPYFIDLNLLKAITDYA